MDIKLWLKDSFSKNKIPDWICPSCESGLLKVVAEQFHFEETVLSASWHSHDDWDPEFIVYVFSGMLKCTNCKDFVSFLGKGSVDHVHYYDNIQDEYFEDYNDVFIPLYFHPTLKLFKISSSCPEDIKNEIIESFKLFWSDLPSCANKVRTSLEMLMNHFKVKKTYLQGGKRRNLSLHKRIEEFRNQNVEIADYLLAIKWIGNTGSHTGKLEKIDILEAFELLEHSLNKLFDTTEDKLKKITKEINKRKGVRKRK
ncbi:MAG: DUF4145 domain-containing protein [Cyclobacteriaceae bacterium]